MEPNKHTVSKPPDRLPLGPGYYRAVIIPADASSPVEEIVVRNRHDIEAYLGGPVNRAVYDPSAAMYVANESRSEGQALNERATSYVLNQSAASRSHRLGIRAAGYGLYGDVIVAGDGHGELRHIPARTSEYLTGDDQRQRVLKEADDLRAKILREGVNEEAISEDDARKASILKSDQRQIWVCSTIEYKGEITERADFASRQAVRSHIERAVDKQLTDGSITKTQRNQAMADFDRSESAADINVRAGNRTYYANEMTLAQKEAQHHHYRP